MSDNKKEIMGMGGGGGGDKCETIYCNINTLFSIHIGLMREGREERRKGRERGTGNNTSVSVISRQRSAGTCIWKNIEGERRGGDGRGENKYLFLSWVLVGDPMFQYNTHPCLHDFLHFLSNIRRARVSLAKLTKQRFVVGEGAICEHKSFHVERI
jgi:hypothetical protein